MHIDSYQFGKMVVDGTDYDEDLIITPQGVRAHWWRNKGHEVSVFDVSEVLAAARPSRLIIGTGASGMCEVLEELLSYCRSNRIELIILPTPEAVVEYNAIEDKSKTVGAFHLTC